MSPADRATEVTALLEEAEALATLANEYASRGATVKANELRLQAKDHKDRAARLALEGVQLSERSR